MGPGSCMDNDEDEEDAAVTLRYPGGAEKVDNIQGVVPRDTALGNTEEGRFHTGKDPSLCALLPLLLVSLMDASPADDESLDVLV
jgi:hypothetical protein